MLEGNGSGPALAAADTTKVTAANGHAPILLVDDTRDNLILFYSMLKILGQPIVMASSGQEALDACRENDFAVILLDVQMPGMDGFEVAGRVRETERGQTTPIIFVTALHTDQGKVSRGYSLGAVDYLFKPVALETLRAKVAAFIDLFLQKQALRQALVRAREAERQLTEQAAELRRSNEELEQFAYVASHDLKEPLRMVTSYVQLLARRYAGKLDADADEFIGFATEGATRMRTLIDDLLKYSRVGTRGTEFAPIDCGKVLNVISANLEVAIAESGAELRIDPLPTIIADERQFEQLFQNLLANAIKFRGESNPVVHVSARHFDDLTTTPLHNGGHSHPGWMFSVRDNGIGIDPQFASKIFLIFQRLHQRNEYPGTGIGLAVCKKIVERHGGRINVDSKPGEGATFRFTIPDKINGHPVRPNSGKEIQETCSSNHEGAA